MNDRAFVIYSNFGHGPEWEKLDTRRYYLNNIECMYMIYFLNKNYPDFDIVLYGILDSYDFLKGLNINNVKLLTGIEQKYQLNCYFDRCLLYFHSDVSKYKYIINIDNDIHIKNVQKMKELFEIECPDIVCRLYNFERPDLDINEKYIWGGMNIVNLDNFKKIYNLDNIKEVINKYFDETKKYNTHPYGLGSDERILTELFYYKNIYNDIIDNYREFYQHAFYIVYPGCDPLIDKLKLLKNIEGDNCFLKFLDLNNLTSIYKFYMNYILTNKF